MGHDCIVVAPSLLPMKAGDRVKTDRRDAVMLAKLHRAGELTGVWVPDAAHEAMRDLIRARATAMRVTGKARQHLQGFLLRHGRIYPGKKGWTGAYRRWLATVHFTHPAQQIVLQDYIDAVADAEARVGRLTGQIADLLPSWSLAPVVTAIQTMRGVAFIVAVTVVAEGRGLPALRHSAAADGVSRADPVGAFQRGERAPRRDHQGGQRPCPARPDRRRLELPDAGTGQSEASRAA